jgi:CRISPR-associated protein Cas1
MDPLAVHGLHALLYCERLYYLENVEGLRVVDAAVYAGRRLHVEIERGEGEDEWVTLNLESEALGLKGRLDCVRRRDGAIIPYEHKRGHAARGADGAAEAWPSDRVQITAYAALVEEHTGQAVTEGRVRYHADHVTVRVQIDETARAKLDEAIARARELAASVERPPVTSNERLCAKCSLAPVCLPEEARKAARPSLPVIRLFPEDDKRQALHVLTPGARVGRAGDRLRVSVPDTEDSLHPVREVGQVVLHGAAQISSQALGFCAQQDISVQWGSGGGNYIGAFTAGPGPVARRIRQYEALREPGQRLVLAKRLVKARIASQLRFLLRASRGRDREATGVARAIDGIRRLFPALARADSALSLLGIEGRAGACYFGALPGLIDEAVDARLRPNGRSRRPPRDPANALLSFGYALLLKDVTSAILAVGLEPAFGFYHTPRSTAHPLALDLIELFRVAMVDMPVIASINRRQWEPDADFAYAGEQVWLSDVGRRKFIEVYERRKADVWKHPALGYSLSYGRLVELETRLLEKEWSGEPGLFACMRLR